MIYNPHASCERHLLIQQLQSLRRPVNEIDLCILFVHACDTTYHRARCLPPASGTDIMSVAFQYILYDKYDTIRTGLRGCVPVSAARRSNNFDAKTDISRPVFAQRNARTAPHFLYYHHTYTDQWRARRICLQQTITIDRSQILYYWFMYKKYMADSEYIL